MALRVFEAFAGVGSQRMALRNLGIDHEVVAIAEIDKFAIKSYEAIHGETNNLGDISQIETADIPDHDLFTYSFPCQDISVAGQGLGLDEGSGTRSGLLWECQKVIAVKKPKYLLLENVKNLVGKKHKHNFDKWLEWLEGQGYTNYHQILNAKDYGVPQNRERVFVISILGEHEPYEFPEPIELELRLKDVLEDEVDEKFYLSKEKSEKLISRFDLKDEPFLLGGEQRNQSIKKDGISTTLTSSMGMGGGYVPMINRLGGIFDKDGTKHQAGAVWDKDQISPTLDTMQGGWRQPSVVVDNSNIKPINPLKGKTDNGWHFEQQVYDENGITRTVKAGGGSGNIPKVIAASRGRNPNNPSDRTVGKPTEQRLEINKQGTSNTITTVQKDNYVVEAKEEYGRMGRQAVETLNENDVKHSDTINPFNKRVSSRDGISPTLTTRPEGFKTAVLPVVEPLGTLAAHNSEKFGAGYMDGVSKTLKANKHDISVVYNNYRIRKLTPKECWRLMGFSDDDFHKAEAVNSNSQLYKQAGNSIVVDVLEGIFKQLLEVAE